MVIIDLSIHMVFIDMSIHMVITYELIKCTDMNVPHLFACSRWTSFYQESIINYIGGVSYSGNRKYTNREENIPNIHVYCIWSEQNHRKKLFEDFYMTELTRRYASLSFRASFCHLYFYVWRLGQLLHICFRLYPTLLFIEFQRKPSVLR